MIGHPLRSGPCTVVRSHADAQGVRDAESRGADMRPYLRRVTGVLAALLVTLVLLEGPAAAGAIGLG